MIEIWDLWYPKAASTGLPFARGRLDASDVLWVHAAPETLSVDVRSESGDLIARGRDLARTADCPMTRLVRDGERLAREDRFPNEADLGALVILPGGEVGRLRAWWNAPDGSEWRWQLEFYNHR